MHVAKSDLDQIAIAGLVALVTGLYLLVAAAAPAHPDDAGTVASPLNRRSGPRAPVHPRALLHRHLHDQPADHSAGLGDPGGSWTRLPERDAHHVRGRAPRRLVHPFAQRRGRRAPPRRRPSAPLGSARRRFWPVTATGSSWSTPGVTDKAAAMPKTTGGGVTTTPPVRSVRLEARPDVVGGKITVVGMSMGGEEAIGAAGADPRDRAVVTDGASWRGAMDDGWLPHTLRLRRACLAQLQTALTGLLSSAPTPPSLASSLRADGTQAGPPHRREARTERRSASAHASPTNVELWELPIPHTPRAWPHIRPPGRHT